MKEQKTGRRIFFTAGLTFFIWNTASIYWVYNAISSSGTGFLNAVISLLVSLIPFGLGAFLMTSAFWLYVQVKKYTRPVPAYIALISFYLAMEYLHQSWDLAFPWMNLGNGFAGMHQLIQWYSYTGIYGGSLWILLSNILAFEAWKAWKKEQHLIHRTAIGWLILILLPIGFSLYQYAAYEEKAVPVNVVTVQPNIDPYEKLGKLSPEIQLSILTRLSDSVAQVNTEYFIWPETALPIYADEEKIRDHPDYLLTRQFLDRYKNGTLITGIESIRWYTSKKTPSALEYKDSGSFYDHYNSAMQIENSSEVAFYHKSKLVPGVEKMPFPKVFSFLAPVFKELGGSVSGWGWQDHPDVFYARSGIGAAPVICYESIWGSWVAQAVNNGAQFIAIITNDGWWGNTSGKDQHLMYAKLRAIETRRWVVRSANTGISAFINQRGDVIKQSHWWTATALKADINLNDEKTFYTSHGDWIAKLFSIAAAGFALLVLYHKWRPVN
ncbi:Apolipoprotein N-acyltransferase [compost metagenome]